MKDLAKDVSDLDSLIPEEHKAWVEHVMQRYNIPPLPEEADGESSHGISGDQIGWQHDIARPSLEEGFRHPNCKVMVNALGTPPDDIMAECKERDILVGALAGRLKHALAHKAPASVPVPANPAFFQVLPPFSTGLKAETVITHQS